MPRDLPLGNGHLLVTFDSTYTLSDVYFPHVGTENHAYRCHSKLGVWVGGQFAWLHDADWERSCRYADETLVTRVEARNRRLGIELTIEDAVDFDENVLLRRFTTRSMAKSVEVRLFLHLDIALGGNLVGDTIFFHPGQEALVAYKNQHYLLLSGKTQDGRHFSSWTMGQKIGNQGSWQDAEDGLLTSTPIAFGSVDCVGELRLGEVDPDKPAIAHAWLAAGSSLSDVESVNAFVLHRNPDALIQRTNNYWRAWLARETEERPGFRELPTAVKELYRRSLLIVRTNVDHDGAIIASPDSEISGAYSQHGKSVGPIKDVFHGQENYAYSWSRDGSLVAMALDNAGYFTASRAYLAFCARTMVHVPSKDHSYMLQKYLANGAVASNVIAWIDEHGAPRLPIQEDETALVLIAMRNHYERSRDWEFVAPLYRRMITTMANFLVDFRDSRTGLPLPSQDLWEERQGAYAFTIATVWRALRDAADFSELFSEPDLAQRYLHAANEVKLATVRYLFNEDTNRFARGIKFDEDGAFSRDDTVDASLWALSYFGMFEPDDPRVVSTMQAVEAFLSVDGDHGGVARFEGDTYQLRQTAMDRAVPGNPWPLCSLWLAQYYLQRAKVPLDLARPMSLLQDVARSSLPSGALAEQIDPSSGEPAGATPLTWTHGTVILTVLEYLDVKARLS